MVFTACFETCYDFAHVIALVKLLEDLEVHMDFFDVYYFVIKFCKHKSILSATEHFRLIIGVCQHLERGWLESFLNLDLFLNRCQFRWLISAFLVGCNVLLLGLFLRFFLLLFPLAFFDSHILHGLLNLIFLGFFH